MGSAAVYGPQKGAKVPNDVQLLDAGLGVVAQRWEEDLSVSTNVKHLPGAGAAGGLGAGLIAFCHASLCSGFDLVAEYAELDSALEAAHLVLTGEGRFDASSAFGKVPTKVAERAKRRGVPVIVLCGSISCDQGQEQTLDGIYDKGITALFSIQQEPIGLEEAMRQTSFLVTSATEQVVRLFMASNYLQERPM
mmetsp:Transcript_30532/g.49403  ORF Transcript_30532/g.49403 Transcript_30532/m.49403 type:complete len:193 (-) Transcript_30532:475-1053(-)